MLNILTISLLSFHIHIHHSNVNNTLGIKLCPYVGYSGGEMTRNENDDAKM